VIRQRPVSSTRKKGVSLSPLSSVRHLPSERFFSTK